MDIQRLRRRYTQIFLTLLTLVSLLMLVQSLSGSIAEFDSRFWGRSFFISRYAKLKLALGDHVFTQALAGKDGWLEYTEDGDLDIYQNTGGASAETLEAMRGKLQKLYEALQKRDITLVLVIAPNKSTIYPDKLPAEIRKNDGPSALDVFTESLQQKGPPILVDLRAPLQNGRKKQDVYYKTDTHWNAYGALIAYTEIMQRLADSHPQLTSAPLDAFTITTSQPYPHDIARFIGVTDLLESDIQLHPKESDIRWATLNDDPIVPFQVATTSKDNAPTLLMYMDSFGVELKDFIAPHFSKTTFILNHSQYPNAVSMQLIDATKPNIVIVEFVERFFYNKKLNAFLTKLMQEKP